MLVTRRRVATLVIWHPCFLIFRFCDYIFLHSVHSLFTNSPQNPILYQFDKSRIAECSFIMSKCGVENPSFSVILHPSIRFSMRVFHPFHQDIYVIRKKIVDIGFIPFCYKGGKTLHRRMFGLDDFSTK
ncbi:Uncharacterised protein [Mycobacterium tuberculosis]|nr:Uncharacterised protein [Mycobacterium tuberculosis]